MTAFNRLVCILIAFTATLASSISLAMATPVLRVNKQSLFVVPAPVANVIDIIDALQVVNDTGTARDVQIRLPTDARSVQVDGDVHHQLQPVNHVLSLPQWAKPHAVTTVTVSFVLPFDQSQGKQFTLHSLYPIASSEIYLAVGNTALSAEDVQVATQTVTISGTTFRVFTRMGIPANDDWTMSVQTLPTADNGQQSEIHDLPVIGANASSFGNTVQAILNLVVAALVLTVGLISIRSTQWSHHGRRRLSATELLYRAWENLESQYQQGLIPRENYLVRRAEFKHRLVAMELQKSDRERG